MSRARLFVLAVALLLCACDKEVARERLASTTVEKEVTCNKTDFCYSCGLTLRGKFECGFHFSPMCPGTQRARVTTTPIEIDYESGVRVASQEQRVYPLESCR